MAIFVEITTKMKRILLLLIAILCLFSCEKAPEEIPVSSVTINQPAAEMVVGETVQLSANVLPSNATDKTLSWASSKQSVATVSSDGLVTAIAEGSSTITVTAGDKSASCKVTVEKKVVPVSSVSLNLTELSLVEGEESTLVATVKPNDADDKTVTWKSSDATIVSVNSEGKVSALKAGTATITASAGDKSASCKVTVEKKFIPVTSVTLNKSELSIVEGSQETLIATVKPDDATDKTVTWKSSNPLVVSVGDDGKVTAIKKGTSSVTASSGDKSATCKVIVSEATVAVTGVSLNKTTMSLTLGETETLTATISPSNATNKDVTWSSSNTTVATVSSSGLVTAMAVGSTTITVTTSDGTKKATCTVTVFPIEVTGIFLDKQYLSMYRNNTEALTATVIPSNATDQSINWSSSNSQVATVSSAGRITAIAAGDAVITAKTNDGGKTANCSVTVWPDPDEAIDLGTSVKWAVRNVGATMPEEFGYHFSWGETAPKSNYSEGNYKWSNGSEDIFSKYNTLAKNGVVDNKIVLDPEDDAAHVNWGGTWRTPTKGEIQELIDNCIWTWTTQGNQVGYKVSSKQNGNSIFLPAAGYRNYSRIDYDNEAGIYLSASLCADTPYYFYRFHLSSSQKRGSGAFRYFGYTVRPVMDKEDRIRVNGISLDPSELKLTEGSSIRITAFVSPANATNKEVIWKSSNTSVATVSEGTVLAIKPGKVEISAITLDGGYTATCSVTVEDDKTKVTSLSLGGTALHVGPGKSYSLKVNVKPDSAVGDFTWKSSDSGTVSVTGNGDRATVTPNYASMGYTTVSVTDKRTGLSASIKVYSFIQSFTWKESTGETYGGYPLITIPLGGTYQLKYSSEAGSNILNLFGDLNNYVFYEPTNVVSSPTNISISPEGLVSGMKEGTTGIKPTGYIQGGGNRVYIKVASKMYESEYNDSQDYANNVPYGFPMGFNLLNRTDVDWFKLQTNTSSGYISVTLSVEYSGASSLSGNESRLCKYSLYDSSMQLWGSGSFSFSKSSPTVSITKSMIPAGPLYLKVYFDTSYDSRLCPLDSMTLKLTVN